MLCGAVASQSQSVRKYMVLYRRQVNADSLNVHFRSHRTPSADRAKTTLGILHHISENSGAAVESFLGETHALPFRKYWIVNGIAVDLPVSLVAQVAAFPDVASVEDITDLKAFLMQPVRMQEEDGAPRAVGAAEPGLLAVGARTLWNLGYTGKGIKLLSFDTGVWPMHPALGGRFYGDYMPLHLAWNGIFSPVPVDKANSHGTHTVGTMSGLDTLTNDTIGLAFKAYFMATDPIVSNLADTIGMHNLMLAYEWALDPDGNPATTDDMPAVICNSWGTAGTSGFCGGFVSDMLVTIDLTGIANEYSAGNDGPGPGTTGVPALVNPGPVNSFAVGAVNGNLPSYPIASFSSRGPTPCVSSGSLKIKPEVVAPGVQVRSCVRSNLYALYDGTSMAGPHVAGVLLLLKEAFPTVAGETLKEALYYSAVDLGDPGEDNTYGMGMINAGAAYDWLVTEGYVPVSPVSVLPELVLEKEPAGLVDFECTSPFTHTVRLYNEGSVAINDTVYFRSQLNGVPAGQWARFISLAPHGRMEIADPTNYVLQNGDNELWVSARQKNTPQEKDMINNNRTRHFTYYTHKTVPYLERFETESFGDISWNVLNPDLGRTFELYNTAGQDSGSRSAAMRFYLYTPAERQKDWLVSPPVQLGNGSHRVAFDVAYHMRSTDQKDTLSLLASLDCGATFGELIFTGSAAEMATYTAATSPLFVPSAPDQWKRLTFDLPSAWNGNTVVFAFRSINGRGGNAYIDDFSVFTVQDPLYVQEQVLPGISVYPNPFTESIGIRFEQVPVSVGLSLFDLGGRKVAEHAQTGNQNITWSPGTNLPSGVYFLRISTGARQKTYKLVKQ